MLTDFTSRYVRDLAWALSSPPLMLYGDSPCNWWDDAWYQQIYEESEVWLRSLDHDPGALATLVEQEKDQRLGRYFELLWTFWFAHSERYEIVAQNVQIEHAGRTIGELDLVVCERATGRNIHFELAVKFYLGLGDTRVPANWFGPRGKDRLDIKLENLIRRQSVLSRDPRAQAQLARQGLRIDACAVIMKGRLFYPLVPPGRAEMPLDSNPAHLKSVWVHRGEFGRLDAMDYLPLDRRGWLAGGAPGAGRTLYSGAEIETMLNAGESALPLCVTGYRNLQEKQRIFIVPDDWSTTL